MNEKLYSILSNKIHSFCDGNGRTCKILSANDDTIRQNIQTNLNYILNNVLVFFSRKKIIEKV